MENKVATLERPNFFMEFSDNKSKGLAKLALIDPENKNIADSRKQITEKIEELLMIESLYFEDISVVKTTASFNFDRNGVRAYPGVRYGVTRLHDDVCLFWERRILHDYAADGNGFPKKVVGLLSKIQELGLPVGLSLTVWTPLPNSAVAVNTDPILVLEFTDNLCIGLMRWNPTL